MEGDKDDKDGGDTLWKTYFFSSWLNLQVRKLYTVGQLNLLVFGFFFSS